MPQKLFETTWAAFSNAFVKFQRLPFGTELRVFDSAGKKKRSDFRVKRPRIHANSMVRASDSMNARALLDLSIDFLSTDLRARNLKVELFGPDGRAINGNMLVRRVRQMEPRQTVDDLERIEAEEALLAEVRDSAYASIVESEHLIEDPTNTVCRAFVKALVERYGRAAVLGALGK